MKSRILERIDNSIFDSLTTEEQVFSVGGLISKTPTSQQTMANGGSTTDSISDTKGDLPTN
jgi:hypothetical protein